MKRRPLPVRILALLWAALQLASPGASAIADGRLAAANASGPTTHVEATTSASCPVVHSPDCGVCRYLSGPAATQQPSPLVSLLSTADQLPNTETRVCVSVVAVLPHGRAPPAL